MPYKDGKWYLSDSAYKVLMEQDQDEQELIKAFKASGDLTQDSTHLMDLWQHGHDEWEATDWESEPKGWSQRYSILQEYAKEHGTALPRNDTGLDLQRKNIDSDTFDTNDDKLLMQKLMGKKDYEVDYAHYNSNLAYRSTVAHMRDEFPDMKANFTSPAQIRKAQEILRGDGYDFDKEWVKQNAMPYTNGEIEALEDFKKHNLTRHFDKEYKITTYLDPSDSRALSLKLYDARKAGNYTRMEEPAAPEWLNIVGGTAPKEEYNADGQRTVASGDVRALYARYLGRDYNDLRDTNIDPKDPKKAVKEGAIGKDEIKYWEDAAAKGNWTYDKLVEELRAQPEGQKNKDRGRLFYNPNHGKEAQIKSKLVAEPLAITPPSLTIRKLKGGVQKPSNLDGFNVKTPVSGGTP